VALTDSGTSALVLALAASVPRGGTVALPAYGCIDLIAAAIHAQVQVRLYDVDPEKLSPDVDSLRRALARGAGAVVIAHFYGYPADMPAVRAVAKDAGVVLIEDAAQHAGGRLGGRALGTFGPLTVLSFGRGKGTTGGRGGALLARRDADPRIVAAVAAAGQRLSRASSGWGDLARGSAQWAFGRPSLYGLPAALPWLGLGETVYHPAHAPRPLSRAAAVLVRRAFDRLEADRDSRARRAAALSAGLERAPGMTVIRAVTGGVPGFLRFPVLDRSGRRPVRALGIVRSYPRSLVEEPATAKVILAGEPDAPGARELCRTLFTLPTHDLVTDADIARIVAWG
jgi:dTDP-4-amino-4,6-dideoxygalactose transaminase